MDHAINKMIVTAALSGPDATKAGNPTLPITPQEIAVEPKKLTRPARASCMCQ